jgi:PKD repeat protein
MRKLYILILVLVSILIQANQLYSQCSNFNAQYPSGTLTPSGTWQTASTVIYGGDYSLYNVVSGDTYYFSLCSTNGGSSSFDSQLTLYDNTNLSSSLAYNDDFCSSASEISWTATFTGVARVLVSQYNCATNTSSATLVYRKNAAAVPTVQDCLGAIPLCKSSYSTAASYSGTGNYPLEIPAPGIDNTNCPNNCLDEGEKNDVWYIFTVSQSGMLDFRIQPNSSGDDYDWAVYNLTNANCSDIYNNTAALQASCNFTGTPGTTGASSSMGSGNCVDESGSQWNGSLPVNVGETYVINVSNFSATQYGYNIDFSQTTASIWDSLAPTIASVATPISCGSQNVIITMSENVVCDSVQPSDFVFTGPGTTNYTVTAVAGVGAGCSSASGYENDYILTISPPITETGNFNVGLSMAGAITDICGNIATSTGLSFAITGVSAAIASSTNPTCSGLNDGTISINASGGTSPYLYSIDGGMTTQASNVFSGLGFGNYTITIVDDHGCSGISSSVTLNNPSALSAGSISADQGICNNGDPVMLSSIAPAIGSGTITYQWEYTTTSGCAGGWADVTGATGATYDPPTGLTTTTCYRRKAMDNCNTTYSNPITVTVSVAPTITAGVDATICNGSSTALAASGGITYSWGPGAGLSATNIATPLASPSATTTYVVTVTNGAGCSASDDVVVNVQTLPAAFAGNDVSVCAGGSVNLTATGGNSYLWNQATTLNDATISNPIATPSSTLTYVVTVTGANTCSNTDDVTVTINPIPNANAGPDVYICNGGSANLSASGGISYSWSPASGLSDPAINNPVATPIAPTTYIVSVSDSKGCVATDNVLVDFYPVTIPVITPNGHTGFCDSASVNVILDAGSGYLNYLWSENSTSQTINITQTGNYSVTITDLNGCKGISAGVPVYLSPPVLQPILLAIGANSFCKEDSVQIYLNNPYYTYEWSSGSITPHIYVFETGNYYCTVTDSLGCVAYSDTMHIAVTQMPDANASYTQNMLDVFFYDFSANNTSVLWDFGDGQTSTSSDPMHTYDSTGVYMIILTAGNTCGTDADTLILELPGPLGISDHGLSSSDINIYPNPVHDEIFISLNKENEEAELTIVDLLGQRMHFELMNNNGYLRKIDISGLSSGVYIIQIASDRGVLSKKFIKE